MNKLIKGNAWLFGDNVNTDAMAPGSTMSGAWEEARPKLFPEKPGVAMKIQAGDIVVAGKNWGCGSSREQAVENMLSLGVGAIVAESFARIFQRNAIANALVVLTCPGISNAVSEGDELSLNMSDFSINNLSTGKVLQATPYNQTMQSILEAGGMMQSLEARFGIRE